jgi:phage shock protein A
VQRDASDVFGLRQQLAAAQQAEAHMRREVGQLRQQMAGTTSRACSVDGEGADFSSRGSVRSGGSSASPARSAVGAAALAARLDAASRELAAAKAEVRLRGWVGKGRDRAGLDAQVCIYPG